MNVKREYEKKARNERKYEWLHWKTSCAGRRNCALITQPIRFVHEIRVRF
jgi:hypothetical protein